ncbi:hypothetical protein [Rhizobium sp. M1]|uniref:hypothetical protein n=1 Tax=Rhizobium sp. M1 TaxID=2035453 RepID=UPI001142A172|nr:hypothetical protein [Rhizobium sp. M1]
MKASSRSQPRAGIQFAAAVFGCAGSLRRSIGFTSSRKRVVSNTTLAVDKMVVNAGQVKKINSLMEYEFHE